MASDRQILLVGCGNMGAALLKGWLAKGFASRQIRVVDAQPKALEVARALGVDTAAAVEGERSVDVVVLAVKPQQLEPLLPSCRPLTDKGAVVLSIAAGKPIVFFERLLKGRPRIVRAMPNTPAAIGQGVTALVANEAVGAEEKTFCERLMSAVGDVVWIDDEGLMDAVTAVSGSGPAYVFLLIEALTAAAREAGLDADLADRLARATVAGAGAYARSSPLTAAALREQVTSPGGTTEAALRILMTHGALTDLVAKAVQAAAARSRELA